MLIPGSQLTDAQRSEVLAAFDNRPTVESRATHAQRSGQCIGCGEPWTACLGKCRAFWPTDFQWINDRAFYFTRAKHGKPSRLAITRPCYSMAEYAASPEEVKVRPKQDRRHA